LSNGKLFEYYSAILDGNRPFCVLISFLGLRGHVRWS